MRNKKPLDSEEQNVYLCEVLLRFARTEGKDAIASRLEELYNSPDKSWTLRWLRDEPWVSNLFLYALIAGENAVADAKIRLLDAISGKHQSWTDRLSLGIRDTGWLIDCTKVLR